MCGKWVPAWRKWRHGVGGLYTPGAVTQICKNWSHQISLTIVALEMKRCAAHIKDWHHSLSIMITIAIVYDGGGIIGWLQNLIGIDPIKSKLSPSHPRLGRASQSPEAARCGIAKQYLYFVIIKGDSVWTLERTEASKMRDLKVGSSARRSKLVNSHITSITRLFTFITCFILIISTSLPPSALIYW